MLNNCKRLAVLTTVSVSVIAAAVLGAASAIHNEHGHEDKFSVGECKRFTGNKEFCQSPESKEVFKEERKD